MIDTTALRDRLDAELDAELDGTGLPDLAHVATRLGTRRQRRRRAGALVACGAVTAVAASGLTLGRGLLDGDPSPAPGAPAASATGPTATAAAHPAISGARADGTVDEAEWLAATEEMLSALLPARYGHTSAQPPEKFSARQFRTSEGTPQLQMWMGLQGRTSGEDPARDADEWSCAAQGAARPVLSCDEADLGNGWLAVATHERAGVSDDGGAPTYGTSLLVMNRGVWLEMSFDRAGWDGLSANEPSGLAPGEIVTMTRDPLFLEWLRVYTDFIAQNGQPSFGAEPDLMMKVPPPRWPV